MKLLEKLFGMGGHKTDIHWDELLSPKEGKPSLVILSASCCNPLAIPGDDKMKKNISEALANTGMEADVHLLNISGAQSAMGSLPDQHKELGNKIMEIFQTKGIGGFPALIVNGKLVLYGGVPEVAQIQEKLEALE